ncbi:uncharacterized protein LOC117139724 [Drosophila mauritiana]|uniref:Uncharacterized protein LOC117139724 n=1 Tax=Drosophila mauritiana TaxID=7226 RepID=A0A6P8K5V1_DROMA|nr:uncharacterized protein LOC117139724 [Drosophila mauritiana]
MIDLNILNLNEDCLHHIITYLSIKDIVNFADTLPRFRQILLDRPPTSYPVHHGSDPDGVKPVLYYSTVAIKLFRIVKNNVKTLGVIQGHSYDKEDLGNLVKDFRILTQRRNKIDLRHCLGEMSRLEDMFRFSSCSRDYLSVNVPSCICYLADFFQLIPDLRELRLSGFAKCSDCVKTILKCFPKLEELWIRGTCLKLRSDYELISQIKSLTKLSINVGGPNCLEPLTNLTELRSLYVESIFSYISPIEIIEIIKKCKKLQFLFCYYINHGEHPQDSIANIFKSIRSTRDPSHQTPLQLHTYLDPPLCEENRQLIDEAYFEYRRLP